MIDDLLKDRLLNDLAEIIDSGKKILRYPLTAQSQKFIGKLVIE